MYNSRDTLEYRIVRHWQTDMSEATSQIRHPASIPSFGLFAAATLSAFTALVILLIAIGFYPEPVGTHAQMAAMAKAQEKEAVSVAVPVEAPVAIKIDSINLDSSVINPDTTDIATLDAALLMGAVRYPGSASVGEEGTMLIFGHSSYLPVVHNQAFKAFNGLGTLEHGTVIRVRSTTTEEVYRVQSVRMVKATEEGVNLSAGGKRLVLVTCNNFGDKSDRYMVEAAFVGSYPVPE